MDHIEWTTFIVDGQDREYEVYVEIDEKMWDEYVEWIKKKNPSTRTPSWDEMLLLHQFNLDEFNNVLYDSAIDDFLGDTQYSELLESVM